MIFDRARFQPFALFVAICVLPHATGTAQAPVADPNTGGQPSPKSEAESKGPSTSDEPSTSGTPSQSLGESDAKPTDPGKDGDPDSKEATQKPDEPAPAVDSKETDTETSEAALPAPKVDYQQMFLGEYVGMVASSFFEDESPEADTKVLESASDVDPTEDAADQETDSSVLALQLRPTGKNRFDALMYRGGLPGAEGCQLQSSEDLIGIRNGKTLILSGSSAAIFVTAEACTLVDADGNKLGKLERVQRKSPTLGVVPPEGAIVVFNGSGTEELVAGNMNEDGWLQHGTLLMPMLQDFDLHLEFRLPLMSGEDGQARGNSGVYLQSRYECQILDSFAKRPVFNGCGSLYRFKAPDANAALPPLRWQTYDIRFTSPRWNADGTRRSKARVTSFLNGVLVQDDVALGGPTGAGKDEAPTLLPTKLQDHGDEVWFRNIWIIDRALTPNIDFPISQPSS